MQIAWQLTKLQKVNICYFFLRHIGEIFAFVHVPQLTVLTTLIPARLLCRDGVCGPFGLLTLDAFSLRKVVIEAESRGQEERKVPYVGHDIVTATTLCSRTRLPQTSL